jgi:ABC-type branched-subunit amino acid transport system ATPase component
MIEVADLRFSYPGGHVALAGASFEVRNAESVALMGANGVGKSTLLLCIVGIYNGTGRKRRLSAPIWFWTNSTSPTCVTAYRSI